MSLCIIFSTITVSNVNSNKYTLLEKLYICRDHRVHRGLGLDESEFTKSVLFFLFYFIRPFNIRVTVLYLLRALHRRSIVHRILQKNQRIRASLATANYDKKQSDCLLSRSHGLIEL